MTLGWMLIGRKPKALVSFFGKFVASVVDQGATGWAYEVAAAAVARGIGPEGPFAEVNLQRLAGGLEATEEAAVRGAEVLAGQVVITAAGRVE